MSVKCHVCGKDFVIGEGFYQLVPVMINERGTIQLRMPSDEDENEYICVDCIDVDLTPIDEPRRR